MRQPNMLLSHFDTHLDALVDAPPEVLLALAAPGEDGHARLRQRRRHLVLRRVDVARGPADLRRVATTTTVNCLILQSPFLRIATIFKEGQCSGNYLCHRVSQIWLDLAISSNIHQPTPLQNLKVIKGMDDETTKMIFKPTRVSPVACRTEPFILYASNSRGLCIVAHEQRPSLSQAAIH